MSAKVDVQTEDLRLLLACLAEGSLSAAAKTLGLTQAGGTRRLQRLEAAVGFPVLHRTTRALRATAEGERLVRTARVVVGELEALERSHDAARGEPAGEVHVSAPVLLGQSLGSMLAVELARRHPELRLRLSLSNAKVDLVRSRVDIALRVGALPDTGLHAARIATAGLAAYAKPDRRFQVTQPQELVALPWVGLPSELELKATGPKGQRFRARVRQVFTCDDRVVLRGAALAGLGAALLPTFFGDAERGLVRLLPEWSFGKVPLSVVWLPEARGDLRVKAVRDAMVRWGAAQAW
ncbi:MAG: LysR family transcriptional regulator [Myxococcaceae bacterium]|nr:LysR family transcriptional regulator [Myxococcaceae bacterium]